MARLGADTHSYSQTKEQDHKEKKPNDLAKLGRRISLTIFGGKKKKSSTEEPASASTPAAASTASAPEPEAIAAPIVESDAPKLDTPIDQAKLASTESETTPTIVVDEPAVIAAPDDATVKKDEPASELTTATEVSGGKSSGRR